MKLKQIIITFTVCTFVFAACSEWAGDEGYVNIRVVGLEGASQGARTVTILPPEDDKQNHGDQMKIDIYFVKEVVNKTIGEKPKKGNIVADRGNLNYKSTVTISMVPGTYIVILNAFKKDNIAEGMQAQGIVKGVNIKPGKNEEIIIPVYTVSAMEAWADYESQPQTTPPSQNKIRPPYPKYPYDYWLQKGVDF